MANINTGGRFRQIPLGDILAEISGPDVDPKTRNTWAAVEAISNAYRGAVPGDTINEESIKQLLGNLNAPPADRDRIGFVYAPDGTFLMPAKDVTRTLTGLADDPKPKGPHE